MYCCWVRHHRVAGCSGCPHSCSTVLLLSCCCLLGAALLCISRCQRGMHLAGHLLQPATCGGAAPWSLLSWLAGAWGRALPRLGQCALPVLLL